MLQKSLRIPESVIRRLPVYLRHLEHLRDSQIATISSHDLGFQLDLNPAQIRKDLAYFGEFGRKGIGYEVSYLIDKITQILKLNRQLPVALIGAGHLGIALCHYSQQRSSNLQIKYVFDKDESKIGTRIGPIVILSDTNIESSIQSNQVHIAMIAVPAEDAQVVTDRVISAGVTAILNFAPVSLRVPEHVHLRNAEFTSELQSLAYYAED